MITRCTLDYCYILSELCQKSSNVLHLLFWPLGVIALNYIYIIWLSNITILSVPDEGCSRNVSCAPNLISTFLFTLLSKSLYLHSCFNKEKFVLYIIWFHTCSHVYLPCLSLIIHSTYLPCEWLSINEGY
jgi:hypothetical protein